MKYIISESQYKILTETIVFEDVYKQTYPKMFRTVCMKYAKGDYDLANEYCQLGYVKVYHKLHTFKNEGSLEGWIRTVLTTTILNELRLKNRNKEIKTVNDFDFERNDIADEPEQKFDPTEFMGKYTEDDIEKAIASLPEGYKFVFTKYFYDDKSHKEIADELGIGEATSRSQLSKAKLRVKSYLENLKR
jgi:RNA polymerase sigma-70 factor (ECF subfamily)